MEWTTLDAAPPRGRAALRAILAAEWALLRVEGSGHGPALEELAEADPAWAILWTDATGVRHATLTPWAAERLGAEVDSTGRVRFAIVVERDPDGTETKTSVKVWDESDRWTPEGSNERTPHRHPRTRGFAPLPFGDRIEARESASEDEDEDDGSRHEEWTLLGRVVGRLRKSPASKKRKAKRR